MKVIDDRAHRTAASMNCVAIAIGQVFYCTSYENPNERDLMLRTYKGAVNLGNPGSQFDTAKCFMDVEFVTAEVVVTGGISKSKSKEGA